MQKNRVVLILVALSLTIPVLTNGHIRQTAKDTQETKSSQNLVREVRHQLLLLPYYTVFDNLAFVVDGDHITLEGQVTNPTLKHAAGTVVKSIEGWSSVAKKVEDLGDPRMDDQLRRALYRAIYGDPTLSKYGWSS